METTQHEEGDATRGNVDDCNKITNEADGSDNGVGSLAKYGVPPFLTKLFKIVNDKTTDSIISWGSTSSFIIFDEQRFKSEILPSYFKTSRLDSFASQLNNYGFKKNEWNRLEFEHEFFQEGKQHLLQNINRRNSQSKVVNNTKMLCVASSEIKDTFVKVKQRQKQIKNRIQQFKYDIEKSLLAVQSISETINHKLVSTFSEGIGRKRKFVDMDTGIDFIDIEKDVESVYDQLKVSDGNDVDIFTTLNDLTENPISIQNGLGGAGGNSRSTPPFLHKLYDMVEKKEIDHLISWKLPSRDSFVIWDTNKFATDVLPMYFSHKNFSSFNSQLNIYRFKKVCWERHEYANEWFRGGRTDLLAKIKRREKNIQGRSCAMTFSSKELEIFKNRLITMQDEQENKISRVLNYEEQMKKSVHEFKKKFVDMDRIVDKMILKKSEKDENIKKVKLDIEENVIDRRDLEVAESRESHIVSINNNAEPQSCSQDLRIDIDALEKIMALDDSWIIKRDLDYYLSWCCGNSNEIDEKFG